MERHLNMFAQIRWHSGEYSEVLFLLFQHVYKLIEVEEEGVFNLQPSFPC